MHYQRANFIDPDSIPTPRLFLQRPPSPKRLYSLDSDGDASDADFDYASALSLKIDQILSRSDSEPVFEGIEVNGDNGLKNWPMTDTSNVHIVKQANLVGLDKPPQRSSFTLQKSEYLDNLLKIYSPNTLPANRIKSSARQDRESCATRTNNLFLCDDDDDGEDDKNQSSPTQSAPPKRLNRSMSVFQMKEPSKIEALRMQSCRMNRPNHGELASIQDQHLKVTSESVSNETRDILEDSCMENLDEVKCEKQSTTQMFSSPGTPAGARTTDLTDLKPSNVNFDFTVNAQKANAGPSSVGNNKFRGIIRKSILVDKLISTMKIRFQEVTDDSDATTKPRLSSPEPEKWSNNLKNMNYRELNFSSLKGTTFELNSSGSESEDPKESLDEREECISDESLPNETRVESIQEDLTPIQSEKKMSEPKASSKKHFSKYRLRLSRLPRYLGDNVVSVHQDLFNLKAEQSLGRGLEAIVDQRRRTFLESVNSTDDIDFEHIDENCVKFWTDYDLDCNSSPFTIND